MGSELKRVLAFLVVLTMALAGCGGGGGDSAYSVPDDYTGETAQATLTSENAEVIVLEAFEGGADASNLAVIPMAADGGQAAAGPLAIAQILKKAVLQANPTAQVSMAAVGDDCTPIDIEGATGSGCYTLDPGFTENSFSGTMVFASYSEDGTASLTGTVRFTVNQSIDTLRMTITYETISALIDGETIALHGSISFKISQNITGSDQISFNVVMQNETTEKHYFYDFTYVIAYGADANNDQEADYSEVSVSGRFYSSDYGFVVVSTVTPLHSYAIEYWPSSGQLKFQGAASSATMTFTAEGAYTIQCSDGGVPVTGTLN